MRDVRRTALGSNLDHFIGLEFAHQFIANDTHKTDKMPTITH